MKKNFIKIIVGTCLLIFIATGLLINQFNLFHPVENTTPIVEEISDQERENFDTSIIEECWCGSFDDGTVRMLGAWQYADGVVEDEQGQLWGIDQEIDENDFLLLWIADNYTPDNVIDDIVVKVWREAY